MMAPYYEVLTHSLEYWFIYNNFQKLAFPEVSVAYKLDMHLQRVKCNDRRRIFTHYVNYYVKTAISINVETC